MRKAAGIIIIVFGVTYLGLWISMVWRGIITHNLVFEWNVEIFLWIRPAVGVLLILFILFITGGVLCIRRIYWGLCLTSSVLFFICPGASLLSGNFGIIPDWIDWVMLVAAVIAVIFILRTKKEWAEIPVHGEQSYGG